MMRKKEKRGLTSSETRGMDFLLGRHSRSVLMSLKKGFAPGGPDCVAPVFSWIQKVFYNQNTEIEDSLNLINPQTNLLLRTKV